MTRLALAVLALLIGAATAHAAETIHQFAERARGEAQKLRRDAQLVQIDVTSFSLAMDRSGWPDMSKVGPPAVLLFYYLSPTTRTQIRVLVRADLTAGQQQFLQERRIGAIQTEEFRDPVTSYTRPIPDRFAELNDALAAAEQGGFQRDCAGVNPNYGCGPVVRAELHTYWNGEGPGTPIWTLTFGQDVHARMITRQVDAITGRVVMVEEGRPGVVAPFSSLSIRAVLSYTEGQNPVSVTAIRDGQQVVLLLTARVNTRVVAPVSCVVFRSSTGAEAGQKVDECQTLDGTFGRGDRPLTIISPTTFHLGPGRNADVIEITWSLTGNGITQQAQDSIRISR